ncbi:amidohydrolase [Streptomyces sp. 2224.1]|uniref:M20 metallopeptidase family protein n=1 Tax=unclassified Streptomyces TaxID=2593676 RepID=UPI00087E7F84|nr:MULTISPECIES: M20 family metallopeptidase [unclassified Streptomyces]PBC86158.1 amidohydrolase [Streptomyces sp. 2321.6]SDQ94503.1 amidohydrolase [Streptomyces sp. KS_16]SED89968.1 amidohydrolase [Streptomyces sp. 2133.1]SED99326.1 amidohydrolase [Streptomyces sp. 2224.1]SNC73038.1 amidohydrolase [Streptomyces sp. 2114.4]
MTGRHLSALTAALDEELPAAAALRHRIHARPCLSGAEAPTRDLVLAALPAGATTKVADTGAVVRIGGPGPAVAVRAELDALAVQEMSGAAWASAHPGLMHACGHDVHLAALTALARAVDRTGGPAPLLAVLQPREETYPSGAQDIVEDGILDREECRAMIGAHVQPLLPAGTVACTPGGVNASSDEFTITVRGRSGHAAYPHLTRDPVVALAHLVVALQSLVSRGTDPMSHVVLSVSTLAAGTAANVIPGTAEARGTLRALGSGDREMLHTRLAEVAALVAQTHGCTAQTDIIRGEPVLDNDPALTAATRPLLGRLGLSAGDDLRSAGSDDFSFFCAQLPSLMLFVGTHGGTEQLHSPTFLPPDERIRDVAHAMLAGYLAAAEPLA